MFQYDKNHKGDGYRKKAVGFVVIIFLIAQHVAVHSELLITYATEDSGTIVESGTDSALEEETGTDSVLEEEEHSLEREEPTDGEEPKPEEKQDTETAKDDAPTADDGEALETGTDSDIIEEGQSPTEEELTEQLPDAEETKDHTSVVNSDLIEVEIPIYKLDIVNVVVPGAYQIAFNPYGFPIRLDDGTISEAQILSKDYGIANKSSWDMLVTVTLNVEDLNGGKIQFVDSPEEVEENDAYAVYLALVPADESGVRVGNSDVDLHVTKEELSDISMTGVAGNAVALHEGTNTVTFKLSKAVYNITQTENDSADLVSLAPDGTGVTAFTFAGTVNRNANWMELSKGIRISAVYTYEIADGSEEIIEGTGAMISIE